MIPKGRTMSYNELPNWYGIPGIGFEWRGSQSDALLHYKGRIFNDPDIENALWDNYLEDGGNPDNHDEWESYVMHNAVNYLEDVIYFTESE